MVKPSYLSTYLGFDYGGLSMLRVTSMVQRWYAWLLFCRGKPMFAQFVSWLLASLVHYLVRDTALVQGGYA